MSFLAREDILAHVNNGELVVANFNGDYLRQASYDLQLGQELYIVGEVSPQLLSDDEPYARLQPGQFAVLTSHEMICIPENMMAFISVRTKYKMQGLVNISGFHVDPSFKGVLRFGVQNIGPTDIHIKFCEPTFTIFFAQLTPSRIGADRSQQDDVHFKQNLKGIRLEDVQLLGGNNLTLSGLQKEIDHLRTLVNIYGAAAVSALVALILRLIFR